MAAIKGKPLRIHLKDHLSAVGPSHIQSAGDQLIKDLVRKQTNLTVTLEEQLNMKQNFVASGECQENPLTNGSDESLTIEELRSRTGLSREPLEEALSIKPNSHVAKLFRFALANQQKKEERLIDRLVDHPLNRLKEIAEECFREKEEPKKVEERVTKRRKKRKRRKKKSKCVQEVEESDCDSDQHSDDDSDAESHMARKSLWDVRHTSREVKGCANRRLFTIKDGAIVEVNATDDSCLV